MKEYNVKYVIKCLTRVQEAFYKSLFMYVFFTTFNKAGKRLSTKHCG